MVMGMICCLARFREGVILINHYHVPRDLAFAPIAQLEVQRPSKPWVASSSLAWCILILFNLN